MISGRTAKIWTVYLGPVETGKVPVIEDKAIYHDEMQKCPGVSVIKLR